VATLPPAERERLEPLPPNVRAVEFAPLHALAATCSAVINHGGAGTVLSMLDHGVPQVIVPRMQFDEKLMAAGVGRAGAAVVLTGGTVGGTQVREALDRVLTDPAYARGAAGARDRMRELPSPNEVVGTLTGLVRETAGEAPKPVDAVGSAGT
ncbi:glycosyltransferase, partial [Nocardiopsis quinghaiensis]|uniref:glycosyltransferase n=1 Tax=Nocardiopsis quinghaiensis TaxID=464995 RepID=UPI0029585BB4